MRGDALEDGCVCVCVLILKEEQRQASYEPLRITSGRLKSHKWTPEETPRVTKRAFPMMFQAGGRV